MCVCVFVCDLRYNLLTPSPSECYIQLGSVCIIMSCPWGGANTQTNTQNYAAAESAVGHKEQHGFQGKRCFKMFVR